MFSSQLKTSLQSFDRKSIKTAGVDFIILHGCPECDKYVYTPEDKANNCPYIKADGTVCGYSRYDESHVPHEVGECNTNIRLLLAECQKTPTIMLCRGSFIFRCGNDWKRY